MNVMDLLRQFVDDKREEYLMMKIKIIIGVIVIEEEIIILKEMEMKVYQKHLN